MIRCIVIDDEKQHRDFLRDALKNHFPDTLLVDEASSVIEGIQVVNKHSFDLLFLDVQMAPLTGFDVLKSITRRDFEVVFTTSFDSYALEAIKFSALDYLLKPYSTDDLKGAIERYHHKAQQILQAEKIDNLLHNINPENKRKRIGLSDKNGIAFYEIDDIVYAKSENVYTTFYFINHEPVVTSKPIKEYERELSGYSFFRIHNSYLINMGRVKKYIRGDGGQVVMNDNTTLDVARQKKDSFLERLSKQ